MFLSCFFFKYYIKGIIRKPNIDIYKDFANA